VALDTRRKRKDNAVYCALFSSASTTQSRSKEASCVLLGAFLRSFCGAYYSCHPLLAHIFHHTDFTTERKMENPSAAHCIAARPACAALVTVASNYQNCGYRDSVPHTACCIHDAGCTVQVGDRQPALMRLAKAKASVLALPACFLKLFSRKRQ
jgi:hypothetical protein